MKTAQKLLEENMVEFFEGISVFEKLSRDLFIHYDSQVRTDSTWSALVNANASTFSTSLSKRETRDLSDLCEQLIFFFGNQAMTSDDYLSNIKGIQLGSDQFPSPGINVAIESFGERGVDYCTDLLALYELAVETVALYEDAQIDLALAAVSGDVLPFSNTPKSDLVDGIALMSALVELISNLTPASADYSSTVSRWQKYIG